MMTIFYRKQSLHIASCWEDLSARQYVRVVKLLHKTVISTWEAEDNLLRILSGLSWWRFHLTIPADLRWRCYEHLKWVFEKQDCTTQLLPVYKKLYGPASEFNNLRLSEFHNCEIAYQQYCLSKSQDVEALNILAAILYREPKKNYNIKRDTDGDLRRPFNANELEYYINKVSNWPMAVRQAIFMWYDACREKLFKDYREAFTGTTKKDSYAQGLFEMMRSIAGGKYGSFKEVEDMYVHTAFLEIIACRMEAKELERQQKLQQQKL